MQTYVYLILKNFPFSRNNKEMERHVFQLSQRSIFRSEDFTDDYNWSISLLFFSMVIDYKEYVTF